MTETGTTQTFVLGASCKTERVGAERDLFLEPNADFMPVISDDSFMHLKTFARIGPRLRGFLRAAATSRSACAS